MSHLLIVRWWFAITFCHFSCILIKKCVVILKFGSTVSCSLTRETRFTKHKPTAQHTRLLDCMKYTTLNGNFFTQWSLSSEIKVLYGRIVVYLSQEHLHGLLNKAYNLLKLKLQNFLSNCMGISVYYHLNNYCTCL